VQEDFFLSYIRYMTEYIKSREFFEENSDSQKNRKHPIIICWKLNTPNNMGSILRIADNMACEKVLFVDDEPSFRERNIKKTAQSSYKAVEWHFCKTDEWQQHIPEGYKLLAIETAEPSTNLYRTELPEKCAFFLGNEMVGLDRETLKNCEKAVYIPMMGHNKSMNVSQALSVVLGEWQRQNYFK